VMDLPLPGSTPSSGAEKNRKNLPRREGPWPVFSELYVGRLGGHTSQALGQRAGATDHVNTRRAPEYEDILKIRLTARSSFAFCPRPTSGIGRCAGRDQGVILCAHFQECRK